jgi:nucleosome binding factor SPN SPT16 subunit
MREENVKKLVSKILELVNVEGKRFGIFDHDSYRELSTKSENIWSDIHRIFNSIKEVGE